MVKDHNTLEEMLNEVEPHLVGDKIFDIGTGFGTVIRRVLNKPDKVVTSLDPEAWTFDELKEKFKREIEEGRLKLVKKKVEDYELSSGEFDSVISIASLHHLMDPVRVLRNLEKSGPRILIAADWNHKSAGVYNPHSKEDLNRIEKDVYSFAKEKGYRIEEHDFWYMIWKEFE